MTAFTAVTTTRRAFHSAVSHYAQIPPPPPPLPLPIFQAQAMPPKSDAFTEGVKDYVQRSFAAENQIQGVTEEEMRIRLKSIIQDSAQKGIMDNTDWSMIPLPQEQIRNDRAAMFAVPTADNQMHDHRDADLYVTNPFSFSNGSSHTNNKRKSGEISRDTSSMHEDAQNALERPHKAFRRSEALEDRMTHQQPELGLSKKERKQRAKAQQDEKRLRKQQAQLSKGEDLSKSLIELERRSQRFGLGQNDNLSRVAIDHTPNDGPVIGRCQNLEKSYFRLTAAPIPEAVRPLSVLERSLVFLRSKWEQDRNYAYLKDQMKSLRQDLTVQHLKNVFTVNVYEFHARVALGNNDLGEYNQCQTQLRALYKQGLRGNPKEFLAYRILYFIRTCSQSDINDVLADLTVADRSDRAVKHALDVRSSIASGNFHKFFRLFHDTPNKGGYLLDAVAERERLAALATMCKSYRNDVKLSFVTQELGFVSDAECMRFIVEHGGGDLINLKTPDGREERVHNLRLATAKAGSLFRDAKAAAFSKVDIKGQI